MNEFDKIITFESYYDPMLANVILTRLQANGISCFIADENILWGIPYYNEALGGIKIKVFEKDLNKCREVLTTESELHVEDPFETNNTLNPSILCPNCLSTNVKRGVAMEARFHFASLIVSIFLGVPVYFRNAWHCFNCKHNF